MGCVGSERDTCASVGGLSVSHPSQLCTIQRHMPYGAAHTPPFQITFLLSLLYMCMLALPCSLYLQHPNCPQLHAWSMTNGVCFPPLTPHSYAHTYSSHTYSHSLPNGPFKHAFYLCVQESKDEMEEATSSQQSVSRGR